MAPAAWRQPLTPVNQPRRPISVPCACVLSRFYRATPRTTAHQASPSTGFSSQEHWSGLPCPSPGDRPNPGIEPASLKSRALASGFFTTGTAWEARPKKKPLFLLIIILTAYSHAGIPQCMCPGSDRPLHCLCTWAAAGQLPEPGHPSCSCLKSSVTSMHPPLSQCSLLCGTVPSSCLSPSSPETLPLSHSPEGAFPHPAARATRPVRPSRLARHLRECHHPESTSPLTALLEGRCRHSGPGSPSERWGGERGCAALLSLALWGCCSSSPTLAPVISGGVLSPHGKLVITLMPVNSTTPTSYLQAVRVTWPQYHQPGI